MYDCDSKIFLLLVFRKPKLPIEMEYQSQDDGMAPSPAPEDDSTLCSPADITKRAADMFELKVMTKRLIIYTNLRRHTSYIMTRSCHNIT